MPDFKISIAWLTSITIIIFPIIIEEYIKSEKIQERFNKFLKQFELTFGETKI